MRGRRAAVRGEESAPPATRCYAASVRCHGSSGGRLQKQARAEMRAVGTHWRIVFRAG